MRTGTWLLMGVLVGSVAIDVAADDQLVWSTFLGGSGVDIDGVGDVGYNVALAPNGDVIVVGRTPSGDFPTTAGAYQESHRGGEDIFVAALSPDGMTLRFATFIGGSSVDRPDGSLVIGEDGEIWIAGVTSSADFPTTSGAFDRSYGGAQDGFVLALSSDGTSLLFSSYLGSSTEDTIAGLDLAPNGNPTVTGRTRGTDFPVSSGAFDESHNGDLDAFVTQLDATLSSIVASTFLGSIGREEGYEVQVGPDASITIVGRTRSGSYPVTVGAYDMTHNGGQDAFIARFEADLSALRYSTYLGGSDTELADDFFLEPDGSVVMRGWTRSSDFPTTPNALQPSYAGGDNDAFITKLDATGSAVSYSTLLGGSANDVAFSIRPHPQGGLVVAGSTDSTDFPVTVNAFDTVHDGDFDAYVAWIPPSGTRLVYSSFIGGSRKDQLWGATALGGNQFAFAGQTQSPEFPVTPGAFDSTHNGGNEDAVLLRFELPVILEVDSIQPGSGPYAGGYTATVRGFGFDPESPPVVLFGGVAASDVSVIDIETIEVTVPRSPNPGPVSFGGIALLPSVSVDVTVVSSSGSRTLERGFTFTNKR